MSGSVYLFVSAVFQAENYGVKSAKVEASPKYSGIILTLFRKTINLHIEAQPKVVMYLFAPCFGYYMQIDLEVVLCRFITKTSN